MKKSPNDRDQFSPVEVKQRMEAALRGARIAGHKPLKELPKKRAASQRKTAKKSKT